MSPTAKLLHQNGHRSTKQRQQILDVLTAYPQSVPELMSALAKKQVTIDKVTVYRTLDCFVALGIVGKTQFREKTAKYELIQPEGHHHHLVCDRCGTIEDIPLDERKLLTTVGKKTSFQITGHNLEFFGLCARCQNP